MPYPAVDWTKANKLHKLIIIAMKLAVPIINKHPVVNTNIAIDMLVEV
jgi:hypothetical protein